MTHPSDLPVSRRSLLTGAALLATHLVLPSSLLAQDATGTPAATGDDPLSAWNDGTPKDAILAFVAAVTDPSNPGFVPPPLRLAAFDLDGTLWVERPVYVDLQFAEDRARDLIAMEPAIALATPYADLIALDDGSRAALTEDDVMGLVVDSFVGETPATYHELATDWLQTAVNPHFDRRVVSLTYLPMMQLLSFLEANGFIVIMASAGDIDFLRAHAEPVFGIPPERVIGSLVELEVAPDAAEGAVEVRRGDEMEFGVWNAGKPIAIQRHAGLRPILSVGNSDGDLDMLGFVLGGEGERLAMMVHHDDAAREFDYGANTNLTTPISDLEERGIVVISMKNDFAEMFSPGDGPDLTEEMGG